MKPDDLEDTKDLVNALLERVNEMQAPPQVAMAASARLFAQICTDCNLGGEQFMHLCRVIAEKNQWNPLEEKNEKTEQSS